VATFMAFTVVGLVVGCIYALTATGLVVTYTTSGVFNFAHGAIGMIAAFTYWQLSEGWGWHPLIALALVLLVLAPLFGALVERVLIRPLHGAPVDLSLVVTLGLLLMLIGVANQLWRPTTTRRLDEFFEGHDINLAGVFVSYNKLIVIAVAAAVALALRLFFVRSRTGVAMRAVVDSPRLVARNGASPARIQQLSWALGASLASLAGILLAPLVRLDVLLLTLIVINGYAAAAVGRLKSVTLTVVGALVLGLIVTYAVGYLPAGGLLSEFQLVIPMMFLFVVLIVLPHDRLRAGTAATIRAPNPPTVRRSAGWGLALVAATVVITGFLSPADLGTAGRGFAVAFILLSLLLLTGYGGLVSLCQMTFVGLGAFAMGHLGAGGSLVGVLAAVGLSAAVGAFVALPTLRLRGLYLALATLAFAQAMDLVFFTRAFTAEGGFNIDRLHIPGLNTTSDRGYVILLAVLFALAGVAIVAIRRSRFGRRLFALNDSPAASATLGVNINWTKLAVFSVSAGMAGLGGVLLGGLFGTASNNDFLMLNSLVLLLLLRIGGVNTATGAFLGAMTFALFPVIQSHFTSFPNLAYLLTGLGAISLGREPNGIAGHIARAGEQIRGRLALRRVLVSEELASAELAPIRATNVEPVVLAPAQASAPAAGPLLAVDQVTVRFGGVQALSSVDLTAEVGRVTGLIGPNGAGKTTLFNVITGLERPAHGRVRVAGRDVTELASYRRSRLGVARTFQRLELFTSLSVRDNIRSAVESRAAWSDDSDDPASAAEMLIDLVGLRAVDDAPVDALPTGLARLVELGRALGTRPSLLLLDEPSSGLNQEETDVLARLLRSLAAGGMTIVLVEHDMDLVMRVCDVIHVLDFGRIIAVGTPNEIQVNPMVRAAYLGDEELEEVMA
jgi:branched-chain amino acid transport system permease protein